jgi:hypothetical protein
MSQENVELAREAYDALGSAVREGDLEAFFRKYVHPENDGGRADDSRRGRRRRGPPRHVRRL